MMDVITTIVKCLGWFWFSLIALAVVYGLLLWLWRLLQWIYGLLTWQKRTPIYVWSGNSFFMDLLSFSSPDHYEWRKRETPKFIIKIRNWYNGKIKHKNNEGV